jgi:hypothetical protein
MIGRGESRPRLRSVGLAKTVATAKFEIVKRVPDPTGNNINSEPPPPSHDDAQRISKEPKKEMKNARPFFELSATRLGRPAGPGRAAPLQNDVQLEQEGLRKRIEHSLADNNIQRPKLAHVN